MGTHSLHALRAAAELLEIGAYSETVEPSPFVGYLLRKWFRVLSYTKLSLSYTKG